MDTLVLFHTCPHPLSPAAQYPRKPMRFEIFEGAPAAADDAMPPLRARERTRLREQPHLSCWLLRGGSRNDQGECARCRDSRALSQDRAAPATTGCTSSASGETLRIVDLEGNQAADTLFFNADDPRERYSAADTIREQGNIYLTTGTKLLSTCCQPMLTIVGRYRRPPRHARRRLRDRKQHGALCARKEDRMHACRDSFLLAVAENAHFGLTKRDIGPQHQFLHERAGDADGGLTFADGVFGTGQIRRDARARWTSSC